MPSEKNKNLRIQVASFVEEELRTSFEKKKIARGGENVKLERPHKLPYFQVFISDKNIPM